MRILTKETLINWVRSQGETSKVDDVLSGFDFTKPIYEQDFWTGDVLYQLARLPSLPRIPSHLGGGASPSIGNWFGLAGITTRGVAINDGLSGRQALKFEAIAHLAALEGTAAPLPTNVGTGIGGHGGQTQIFVPSIFLGRLECKGQVHRW